ncbi:MAG: hypothetical protein ACYDEV_02160 [Acidiferrobacter sp.]
MVGFRQNCTLRFMQKLAQTGGLLNPSMAPRICGMAAGFLGATPGEWRAIGIAGMQGQPFNQTAAGRQLLGQIKADVHAFVKNAQARAAVSPSTMAPEENNRASAMASYLVARRLRAVRVAMERAAIRQTGSPVRLPVGSCQAWLFLSPSGQVQKMASLQCSGLGIQEAFKRAVFNGQPLVVGMETGTRRVRVEVFAPLAEPGARDGFTR